MCYLANIIISLVYHISLLLSHKIPFCVKAKQPLAALLVGFVVGWICRMSPRHCLMLFSLLIIAFTVTLLFSLPHFMIVSR